MRIFSVISHGHSNHVEKLIKSLEKFFILKDNNFKIVIINNKPADKIKVTSNSFDIQIFNNLRQKGFGENHNTVFEIFQPEIIYIVNPDITFYETCFEIDILAQLPSLGVSTPKILFENKRTNDFYRKPLTFFNVIRRRLSLKEKGVSTWFAGMFLIINKTTFEMIQGFDTKYFMYVEDCDLSYRVVKKGGMLKIIENFNVIHDERRMSLKSITHFKWHIQSLLRFWLLRNWNKL